MAGIHPVIGALAIAVCALAAGSGFVAYRRRAGAGRLVAHLIALGQTALIAQVGIGLLLLADERRATDQLHYLYGSLALAAALTPWFYAPPEGRRRLLWFAGCSGIAAALSARAFMTGS
ncbi:MAG: hypothetical protein ACKVUT_15025 [Gaiella sp.]